MFDCTRKEVGISKLQPLSEERIMSSPTILVLEHFYISRTVDLGGDGYPVVAPGHRPTLRARSSV